MPFSKNVTKLCSSMKPLSKAAYFDFRFKKFNIKLVLL
jgi:hypothetical protein